MRDVELLHDAFENCTVQDGVIKFPKSYSERDLMNIYNGFSEDLLSANIPNYRVVGFWHEYSQGVTSAFRHHNNYSKTIIELGRLTSYMVPDRLGGNSPAEGCFYCKTDELPEVPEDKKDNQRLFNRMYGIGEYATDRNAAVLTKSRDEIGCIMAAAEFNADVACEEIKSDNEWFGMAKFIGDREFPNYLVKNKVLCKLAGELDKNINCTRTLFLIMEGTGSLSYEDSLALFVPEWKEVVPVSTTYDLSMFFTCRYPMPGDRDCLRLTYWEDINEEVLTTILQRYGRRL